MARVRNRIDDLRWNGAAPLTANRRFSRHSIAGRDTLDTQGDGGTTEMGAPNVGAQAESLNLRMPGSNRPLPQGKTQLPTRPASSGGFSELFSNPAIFLTAVGMVGFFIIRRFT